MDPVTHTLMSATIARAAFPALSGARGLLLSVIAGTFPDIDVLFRRLGDGPLDGMLLHRHFTHSVFVAPLGALVAILPFFFWKEERERWRSLWFAATVIYLGHLFVDYCTSYGTLLLWPLTDRRYAVDIVSICDPMLLAIFLAALVWSFRPARPLAAAVGLVFAVAWLTLGWHQRDRALELQQKLAKERGHVIEHGRTTPMLFSLTRWRSIYRAGGTLVADEIQTPFLGAVANGETASVPLFTLPPQDDPSFDGRMRADVEKFSAFADGFVAFAPDHDDVISDMRYSLRAGAFKPLWGIRPRPGQPAEFIRTGVSPLKTVEEMSRTRPTMPAGPGHHAKPKP